MYKYRWYCRWCGTHYKPKEQTDRDGFCCAAHKQAHYRAYRKYVTLQAHESSRAQLLGVTPKKRKKKGVKRGKKTKSNS